MLLSKIFHRFQQVLQSSKMQNLQRQVPLRFNQHKQILLLSILFLSSLWSQNLFKRKDLSKSSKASKSAKTPQACLPTPQHWKMLNSFKIQTLKDLSEVSTNLQLNLELKKLLCLMVSKLSFHNQLKSTWLVNSTVIWISTRNQLIQFQKLKEKKMVWLLKKKKSSTKE